jgi:hypothetical protein
MDPCDKKALVIARRSRKNLAFMDAQKKAGADVEEFTQLLNRMLGMLICLREEYFKGHEVTWDEVKAAGLTPVPVDGDCPNANSSALKPSKTFSKLIGNLRHALAHNCFEFTTDLSCRTITGLVVWNVPTKAENKPENRCWQASLSENILREIADLLINFLEKEHGTQVAADEVS